MTPGSQRFKGMLAARMPSVARSVCSVDVDGAAGLLRGDAASVDGAATVAGAWLHHIGCIWMVTVATCNCGLLCGSLGEHLCGWS